MDNRETQIEDLIQRWRDEAAKMLPWGFLQSIRRSAIEHCADELSALLREAKPSQLRLTICTREHTHGNVYNYSYWKCGHCGYHPGGSDGPPNEHCLNCKARLYTDKANEAALLIRIVPWESGLHFEIVEDLSALRRSALLREEAPRDQSLLSDWQDQDRALQRIWGALGIDGDPTTPADIAAAVERALTEAGLQGGDE